MLHASALQTTPLGEVESLLGHRITSMHDPLQDIELALYELLGAAKLAGAEPLRDTSAAQEALDILLGTTAGRVYDGFALLNYNRGAFAPGHVPHEYKMKRLVDSGETVLSQVDGEMHKIWEVDINMLWYGQNFDSDTFLVRVPFEAQAYDELRVNWRVYSLIQEDLAPTTITNDGFGRDFPWSGQQLRDAAGRAPVGDLRALSVDQVLPGACTSGAGAHIRHACSSCSLLKRSTRRAA